MSSSSGNRGSANDMVLAQLYANKLVKLQEQKRLSDQMNTMLTKTGGLNENNKKALRNLNAAISVSKKPGYFSYHTASNEVKEIEDNRVLNTVARSISKAGAELDQINLEIISVSSRPHEKPMEVSLMSIGQWHDTYGKATGVHEGMITQFEKVIYTKQQILFFSHLSSKCNQYLPIFPCEIYDIVQNPRIYGGTAHHRSFKTLSSVMKKGLVTR